MLVNSVRRAILKQVRLRNGPRVAHGGWPIKFREQHFEQLHVGECQTFEDELGDYPDNA